MNKYIVLSVFALFIGLVSGCQNCSYKTAQSSPYETLVGKTRLEAPKTLNRCQECTQILANNGSPSPIQYVSNPAGSSCGCTMVTVSNPTPAPTPATAPTAPTVQDGVQNGWYVQNIGSNAAGNSTPTPAPTATPAPLPTNGTVQQNIAPQSTPQTAVNNSIQNTVQNTAPASDSVHWRQATEAEQQLSNPATTPNPAVTPSAPLSNPANSTPATEPDPLPTSDPNALPVLPITRNNGNTPEIIQVSGTENSSTPKPYTVPIPTYDNSML